jgi:2-dehydropantoate 2-reductase
VDRPGGWGISVVRNTQPSYLHILSIGAGALGTYISGSLALQGHPVTFLERPDVAELLRLRGLRLVIDGQEKVLPELSTAANLTEAFEHGSFDVAIFALKSYDTPGALLSLIPYSDQIPPILSLQNGVENELILAEALGEEKVIPGTVTSAIGRQAAGDVVLERLRGVGIASGHQLSERLVKTFNDAGLKARLYNNARDMKWSKLLTNLIANASSAILNMPPGDIFSHPGLFMLELAQLRECLSVMQALGIRTVDLPATPVRLLALTIRYLPPFLSRPLLVRAVGRGRGTKMPSFHIDLYSGRGQSEVDYLNGAVVRAGQQVDIPTPANRVLTDTLLGLTSGAIKMEDYSNQPQRLLDLYKAGSS